MSYKETNPDPIPLDMTTGLVVYKGQEYTYEELMDIFEEEANEHSDELAELRDVYYDRQNLWGNKRNRFKDNWFKRQKPLKRRKGYPRDLED